MKSKIIAVILLLKFSYSTAQIEKFPDPNDFLIKWSVFNLDSSSSRGIGCALPLSVSPQYPALFFHDSTGCMLFDYSCFNPLKGYSDDYTIRKKPYKINRQDSLVLWYGSKVNWRNWTTGQTYYKPDTIEMVFCYFDSILYNTDTTYPNPSHMLSLGYLITTQDSIVMKRNSKSLENLLSQSQNDTQIYLGFRKHMFSQDCSAWIDNIYMSNSGLNSTKISNNYPFEIYPNPGKDGFYIRGNEIIELITIRDLSGKIVQQVKVPNNYVETINLAQGIYSLEIKTKAGKTSVKKWVKD